MMWNRIASALFSFQGPPGSAGPLGYPGPRGVKVGNAGGLEGRVDSSLAWVSEDRFSARRGSACRWTQYLGGRGKKIAARLRLSWAIQRVLGQPGLNCIFVF